MSQGRVASFLSHVFTAAAFVLTRNVKVPSETMLRMLPYIPLKDASSDPKENLVRRWDSFCRLVAETPHKGSDVRQINDLNKILTSIGRDIRKAPKRNFETSKIVFDRADLYALKNSVSVFNLCEDKYRNAERLLPNVVRLVFNDKMVDCMELTPALRGEDASDRIRDFSLKMGHLLHDLEAPILKGQPLPKPAQRRHRPF